MLPQVFWNICLSFVHWGAINTSHAYGLSSPVCSFWFFPHVDIPIHFPYTPIFAFLLHFFTIALQQIFCCWDIALHSQKYSMTPRQWKLKSRGSALRITVILHVNTSTLAKPLTMLAEIRRARNLENWKCYMMQQFNTSWQRSATHFLSFMVWNIPLGTLGLLFWSCPLPASCAASHWQSRILKSS